ncbi:MAG: hypothetical protein AVDCRST_MAG67-111, partial [uncultured Solirubrobacteraceae bacterium]
CRDIGCARPCAYTSPTPPSGSRFPGSRFPMTAASASTSICRA